MVYCGWLSVEESVPACYLQLAVGILGVQESLCFYCMSMQVLDPLVLNGAIVLMLGSPHAKVAALGLDVIRAMHAAVPVVDVTPAGITAGPGHVMFSNLVYQVRLISIIFFCCCAPVIVATWLPGCCGQCPPSAT